MGRVVAVEYLTLDGVSEEPAWSAPYFDDEVAAFQLDNLFGADALLLGRKTYEGFAAAWPGAEDEAGFADRMNAIPKHVATRTLTEPTWNAAFLPGDVVASVITLRADEDAGTLLVNGSADLLRQLLAAGQVDELRLMVFPVLVGAGRRLFGEERIDAAWRLTESRTSPSGVALLFYELA